MGELRTLIDVMKSQAQVMPDASAYLHTEADRQSPLSYGGLEQQALAIAAVLAETCKPGDRAMLLYPPGTGFVAALFACMACGVIAVPAPPPHPLRLRRSLPRLQSILSSAKPKVVLTEAPLVEAMRAVQETVQSEFAALKGLTWIATEQIPVEGSPLQRLAPISPESPAVLQYTSGSTGDPKGVILTHQNLLHNIEWFHQGWDHTPESVQVCWLPAFHDLGLVYGVLAPLRLGFLGVLMSPVEIIMQPLRWLKAITELRATHSAGPNFIYDLCTVKVRDDQKAGLDLSSWKMALTAAEPVRAETMRRFYEAFRGHGFRWETFCPGYGLSETTCKVTATTVTDPPFLCDVDGAALDQFEVRVITRGAGDIPSPGSRTLVSSGRVGPGVLVKIVDPESGQECPPHRVGEIWASGPSIGGGYWERPDATQETFQARLEAHGDVPFLRTGDLGFVLNGQLFITGRRKDMLIIRGENYYPQDIEFAVLDAHPAIRPGCCAAFAIEQDGEERCAIVVEVERRHHERRAGAALNGLERRAREDRRQDPALPLSNPLEAPIDVTEVKACILQAVAAQCGLKASVIVLIVPGSLPKTSSGKVQRRATRQLLLTNALERIPEELAGR